MKPPTSPKRPAPPSVPLPARARWVRPVLILFGFALLGGFGGWWWLENLRRDAMVAELPPRPGFGTLPVELSSRVAEAEEGVRHHSHPARSLAELAGLYHANGFFGEAGQCYHALMQAEPRNPRWAHRWAMILSAYGQLDDAIALWQRCLQLDPTYLPVQLRLGEAYAKSNRSPQAVQVLQGVLARDPANPWALASLGRLDLQAGRLKEARDRLEQAVVHSNYAIGQDLLVTVCEQQGDRDRALALRGRAKSSGSYYDPPDPWVYPIYEDCYDEFRLRLAGGEAEVAGDPARAKLLLERAAFLWPHNGQIPLQLGLLSLRQRDYPAARDYFEKTTRVDPTIPDAWAQLIELYTNIHDEASVDRVLGQGLVNCPLSPGLHLARARRMAALGQLEAAIADYRETFRLRTEEAIPLVEMAGLYFQLGRYDEAVVELHHALEVEPEHPLVLTTLAMYAIGTSREVEARSWLKHATEQPRVDRSQIATLKAKFAEHFGHAP